MVSTDASSRNRFGTNKLKYRPYQGYVHHHLLPSSPTLISVRQLPSLSKVSPSASQRHFAAMATPWNPWIRLDRFDGSLRIDDLAIDFVRTLRVPDNKAINRLPPRLGSFKLERVIDHAQNLPPDLVERKGLFFPMYQREAMWIKFRSRRPYAIKFYVGGVNAISGEATTETVASKMNGLRLVEQKKSIQDYVVVPAQRWLDGIAASPGNVRQFVAMPFGTGYSVEEQVTGEEKVVGLQIEITPRKTHLLSIAVDDSQERGLLTVSILDSSTLIELAKQLGLREDDEVCQVTDSGIQYSKLNKSSATALFQRGLSDKTRLKVCRAPFRSPDFYLRKRHINVRVTFSERASITIAISKKDTVQDVKFLIEDATRASPRTMYLSRSKKTFYGTSDEWLEPSRRLLADCGVTAVRYEAYWNRTRTD